MLISINALKSRELKEQKEKDKIWADMIKARDDWSCVICGNQFKPNAHHIVPRENKDFRHCLNNGVTLCTKHHKFSRIISAHNNPMAFFLWLQKYRYDLFVTAVERNQEIARDEVIL
jgi:hypothetical protein